MTNAPATVLRLPTRTACLGPDANRATRRRRSIFAVWRQRARTRAELLEMNEHMLRDIGLTPEQARREGNKPFWRT